MARPKLYSYENFSIELGVLCEKYKRLSEKEMIEALAARSALIHPDCISAFVNAAFKMKMTIQKCCGLAEKEEKIEEPKKKIDKSPIIVIQKKKPGRPRKHGR